MPMGRRTLSPSASKMERRASAAQGERGRGRADPGAAVVTGSSQGYPAECSVCRESEEVRDHTIALAPDARRTDDRPGAADVGWLREGRKMYAILIRRASVL